MARSLTNNFSLSFGIETSLGVAGTVWNLLEPNSINTFGSEITTIPRAPISKNRQRRKGTVTDLDSSVEFEHDFTMQAFKDFVEGFAFANFIGPLHIQAGAGFETLAAASGAYTHDALGTALLNGNLIFARGFTLAVNNGLDEVTTGSTTTNTPTVGGAQASETPNQTTGASIEVCGFRGATGDLVWTDAGSESTLSSTILDFTTLILTVGQFIHVGGLTSTNQFATGTLRGRIVSIATNAIVLDKTVGPLVGVTDTGAAVDVDMLFGRFLRNVGVDDADFLEQSYQFEGIFENLQNPSGTGDEYEYSIGNFCNEIGFQLPLTDKALLSMAFIGQDTEVPVTSQKSGASTPVDPVETAAFNTSADIVRLRITETDETGLSTDFKSGTVTLNNNVSGEKVLGFLGSKFLNTGIFEVNLEAQLLFTDSAVVTAIRNNRTVTMEFLIKNDDGAVVVDIPAMTLGGGGREFPINETILINTTGEAFEDPTLGISLGISLFPSYPA